MPVYRITRNEETLTRIYRNLRPVGVRAALLTTTKVLLAIGLAGFGALMVIMGAFQFTLFFAAVLALLFLSPYVAPWIGRRQLRKSQHFGDVSVIRLDESGISWEDTRGSGRSDWPMYRHVIRKPNGLVVQMESGDTLWYDDVDLIEGSPEDVICLVRPRAMKWTDLST